MYKKKISKTRNPKTGEPIIITTKEPKKPKVFKNDPKYIFVLGFLNALLTKWNFPNIAEITEFKNIKRDEFNKGETKLVVCDYLDKIVVMFGKNAIDFNHKNYYKLYSLVVTQCLVSHTGYKFQTKKVLEVKDFGEQLLYNMI